MSDELFALNKNISVLDARDGIDERLAQVKAILHGILGEYNDPEPTLHHESLFHAIWVVERLINETELLHAFIYSHQPIPAS